MTDTSTTPLSHSLTDTYEADLKDLLCHGVKTGNGKLHLDPYAYRVVKQQS